MKKITFSCLFFISQFAICQQYINGNISTGAFTHSGIAAPAGYTWSELENEPNMASTNTFLNANILNDARIADDFVVPAGQVWNITSFDYYVDQRYSATVIKLAGIYIEIWNGDPALPTSSKIFGDLVTNVIDLPSCTEMNVYSIENTNFAPPFCGPFPSELYLYKVWKARGNITATLPSGTYWMVFSIMNLPSPQNPTGEAALFIASRNIGTRNGTINNVTKCNTPPDTTWGPLFVDTGCPSPAPYIPKDIPFTINYALLGNNDVALNRFTIYPNPAKDIINIEWNTNVPGNAIQKITITDMHGRKVMENPVGNLGIATASIDISSLQKGLYLLNIIDGNSKIIQTSKIIKQ